MEPEVSPASTSRVWVDHAALRQTCSRAMILRSLGLAAVIGTVLNAINQGPELVTGKPVSVLKLLLTYATPFFVASWGAYSAFRQKGARVL